MKVQSKKLLAVGSIVLLFSVMLNVYLMNQVQGAKKQVVVNTKRIGYLEDNLVTMVGEAMKDANFIDTMVSDVSWHVSELMEGEEKTALLHIEFKLKSMDSTSRVYASIEAGEEEAVLVEAHLLNDITYTIDREVNVLEPIRIDLLVEKYGEKRIENLVDEEALYLKYIADTAFNLLDFSSSYDGETQELLMDFDAEVVFSAAKNLELVRSEFVLEKNGIIIERAPLDNSEMTYPDALVYMKKMENVLVKTGALDEVKLAVVLKDKLGFTYRYDFAQFLHINGEPVMRTTSMPELTLH